MRKQLSRPGSAAALAAGLAFLGACSGATVAKPARPAIGSPASAARGRLDDPDARAACARADEALSAYNARKPGGTPALRLAAGARILTDGLEEAAQARLQPFAQLGRRLLGARTGRFTTSVPVWRSQLVAAHLLPDDEQLRALCASAGWTAGR